MSNYYDSVSNYYDSISNYYDSVSNYYDSVSNSNLQGRLGSLVGEVQAQRREEAEVLAALEPLRAQHAALLRS